MVDHNSQGIVLTVVYNATLRLAQLLYMADGVTGPIVTVQEHVEVELKLAQGPAPIQRKFTVDSLRISQRIVREVVHSALPARLLIDDTQPYIPIWTIMGVNLFQPHE